MTKWRLWGADKDAVAAAEGSLPLKPIPARRAMPAELLKEITAATHQLLTGCAEHVTPAVSSQPGPSQIGTTLADQPDRPADLDAGKLKSKAPARHALPADLLQDLKAATQKLLAGHAASSVPCSQALIDVGEPEPLSGSAKNPAGTEQLPQAKAEEWWLDDSKLVEASQAGGFLPAAGSIFDDIPASEAVEEQQQQQQQAVEPPIEVTKPQSPPDAMEEEEQFQPQLQNVSHTSAAGQPAGSASVAEEVRRDINSSAKQVDDCLPSKAVPEEEEPKASAEAPSTTAAGFRRRIRLERLKGRLRLQRARAGSYEPDLCHESDYLSHGHDSSPRPISSLTGSDHRHSRGKFAGQNEDHRSWCTWEGESHPVHESPDDSDQDHALPTVDSAPPVTPDSPARSALPPNSLSCGSAEGATPISLARSALPPDSPSWASCEDPRSPATYAPAVSSPEPYASPPRAAPHSPQQSTWDSPARAPSHSPAPQNTPSAVSLTWLPPPRSASPAIPPWRPEIDSPAASPMRDSSSPSHGGEDPYGGEVVGGLDGDYAYGSYQYSPRPRTLDSPRCPPHSPLLSPHDPLSGTAQSPAIQSPSCGLAQKEADSWGPYGCPLPSPTRGVGYPSGTPPQSPNMDDLCRQRSALVSSRGKEKSPAAEDLSDASLECQEHQENPLSPTPSEPAQWLKLAAAAAQAGQDDSPAVSEKAIVSAAGRTLPSSGMQYTMNLMNYTIHAKPVLVCISS